MYERIAYQKTSNRSYRFWRPARDAVMKTLMTRSISRPLHADNEDIELLMGEVGLCLTHVPEEVAADVGVVPEEAAAESTTASIYILRCEASEGVRRLACSSVSVSLYGYGYGYE